MSEDPKRANKRIVIVLLVVVILGAGATAGLYLVSTQGNGTARALPAGCAKPTDGFVVIASSGGYNDSIAHGAPLKTWPIISVKEGQNVTIVVCNIDVQAHGFQITHYYDASDGHSLVTITPGQVIRVSFIADQAGSFQIYCAIFCSIHQYMQSGRLNVTSSA